MCANCNMLHVSQGQVHAPCLVTYPRQRLHRPTERKVQGGLFWGEGGEGEGLFNIKGRMKTEEGWLFGLGPWGNRDKWTERAREISKSVD